MRKTRNDWRLAVRVLCSLALVFVAFAHKPMKQRRSGRSIWRLIRCRMALFPCYASRAAAISDLHKSTWHGTGCEACRLVASFILPVPPVTSGPKVQPARRSPSSAKRS